MPPDLSSDVGSAFSHLCEQHISEVAHLWGIWYTALSLPHYNPPALKDLESRIHANIAGVRTHGDDAWRICMNFLDIADASEIFSAAQIAFRSYNVGRIKAVVDTVEQNPLLERGLISALAWLPGDIAHPWQKKFLESKQLWHKRVALQVCRIRGEDPAAYLNYFLQRGDCLADKDLLNVALQCIGEFKRRDLQTEVEPHLSDQNETRFCALYASLLLGKIELAEQLKPFVFSGPCQETAVNLAVRVLPHDIARDWIREMVNSETDKKWAIVAAQALGDPQVIPWLVGLMREPIYARLAGHAFYAITGVDLDANDLAIADPVSLEQKIEHEMADESADMPSDEHLSWPDIDRIWFLWTDQLMTRFTPGKRYFLGTPLTEISLKSALINGFQPQRHAAALELALTNKPMHLISTFGCIAPER